MSNNIKQQNNQNHIDAIKNHNIDILNSQIRKKNQEIKTYFDLKTNQKNLIKKIFWLSISTLLNIAFIIFIFLQIFNIKILIGINAETENIITANPWVFLIGIAILNFILALILTLTIKLNLNFFRKFKHFLLYYFGFISIFNQIPNSIKDLNYVNKEIIFLKRNKLLNFEKSEIFYLTLVGLLLGFFILLKFLFSFWKVFGGWSIEVDVMFYLLCLILIDRFKYLILFAILAPILALPLSSGLLYFFQILFEYLLAYWILIPICCFHKINNFTLDKIQNKKKEVKNLITLLIFFALSFLLVILKTFCHILAGVIWWTNGDWIFSIILNLQIIIGSFFICLPFVLITIVPILKLREIYLTPTFKLLKESDF